MADDVLELDAPVDDQLESELPAEGADLLEGEQLAEDDQQTEPVTSLLEADGKAVAKPIKGVLAKLKSENAPGHKLIADAVYRFAEFKREFPGGLTEAREMRDQVEQYGGLDEVKGAIEASQAFTTLANQFKTSDPGFIQDLVDTDPEAFAKMVPQAMDRYREENADGWNAYIARTIDADIRGSQVPLCLMRLYDLVKDNKAATDLIDVVNSYLGGFAEIAKKTPSAARAARPAGNKPDANAQRENDLRAREWNTERREMHTEIRTEAFTKAVAGRKPTTEEKAQIEELFQGRAARLASTYFKDWQKKSQAYIARNDKTGYLRYMGSIYRRVTPEAMSSAVAATLKGKAVAPPAGGKRLAAPVKPGTGFVMVGKEPGTYEIDYSATTRQMLSNNQAVLKNGGRKVQWR